MRWEDVGNIYRASGFSREDREPHDYYATPPEAVERLLEVEEFYHRILEPCCGEGHISRVLAAHGHEVVSYDLIDRGFGIGGVDFLKLGAIQGADIITNPPYKESTKLVRHALDIQQEGRKVAMLLKIQFLEGLDRAQLFDDHPPKKIYVFSKRIKCAKNGDFSCGAGTICFAWYIWQKGYKGETILKWLK